MIKYQTRNTIQRLKKIKIYILSKIVSSNKENSDFIQNLRSSQKTYYDRNKMKPNQNRPTKSCIENLNIVIKANTIKFVIFVQLNLFKPTSVESWIKNI